MGVPSRPILVSGMRCVRELVENSSRTRREISRFLEFSRIGEILEKSLGFSIHIHVLSGYGDRPCKLVALCHFIRVQFVLHSDVAFRNVTLSRDHISSGTCSSAFVRTSDWLNLFENDEVLTRIRENSRELPREREGLKSLLDLLPFSFSFENSRVLKRE